MSPAEAAGTASADKNRIRRPRLLSAAGAFFKILCSDVIQLLAAEDFDDIKTWNEMGHSKNRFSKCGIFLSQSMPIDGIFFSEKPNHFTGVSDCNGIVRDVFGHHRAGANDNPAADGDAGIDNGSAANPYMVTDDDGLAVFKAGGAHIRV